MEFKQLTQERRSVRQYAEGISHEEIQAILDEARMAPSWKNNQTCRCYAVESPELLEKFRQAVLPPFNQKNSAHAALIVSAFVENIAGFNGPDPANEAGNLWGAYDLGLHDAYLVLAARDHGYDTLIMGIRDAEAIREMLQVPESEQIMSVIAIGKRGGEPLLRPRKELEELVKFF